MTAVEGDGTIRLLLAEDNPGDARLISELLRDTYPDRFSLDLVSRLDEAVERMSVGDIDALLLDLGLPDSQGLDTYRRAQESVPHEAIIVISGRDDEQFALDAVRAGAQDYLVKGNIQQQLLLRVIRYAIARKKAEDALRASEMRFRRVVDSNMLGIFFWSADGRIVDANDAFLSLVGYSKLDIASGRLNWRALTPERYADTINRTFAQLERFHHCEPFEKEYIRRDGQLVPVLFGAATTGDDTSSGVAFVLDLTQRRHLEGQLRQKQKMESVGRLAGGIAHDFNNLLTVILAESESARQVLPDNAEARESITEIRKAGDRAAGLTRQLLMFSRQQVVNPSVFAVNDIVDELDKMLNRLLGERVSLQKHLTSEPALVRMDRGQLEQVVVNLVVNARDAMPQGGTATLATHLARVPDALRPVPDVPAGAYVVITVSDTGQGIPQELQEHIFEPFFTTKEPGRGTGLGLATCYGIARECGGAIQVASTGPSGTAIEVWIPATSGTSTPMPAAAPAPALPSGGETILIVEDEDPVRRVTERILTKAGYRVIAAAGGDEALAAVRADKTIALIFTDVVLRNLNGREVAERARAIRPGIKVLFTSGHTDDEELRRFIQESGDARFLQKPYRTEELRQSVRAVLDG